MARSDASRAIGKIISVSADRLLVELHRGSDNFTIVGFDDIHYVATLGSYLMVPVQAEYVVLEVVGLRERDSASTHVKQVELDKASSVKFLDVVPVGSMPVQGGSFRFGVSTFPPLYADVLYARDEDLDRIFNVNRMPDSKTTEKIKKNAMGKKRRGNVPDTIEIGTSVVFKDYPVKLRLDELFGGHIAVLGNTGSGKSCTVASIFQSVFMKVGEFAARGAAFVIFDVNGEYWKTIEKIPTTIKSCYLKACAPGKLPSALSEGEEEAEKINGRFTLPHWFMNFDEWALLLRASEKSQIPVLRTALGLATLFGEISVPEAIGNDAESRLKDICNHVLAKLMLSILQSDGTAPSKQERILDILSTFRTDEIVKNREIVLQGLKTHFGNFKDRENHKKLLKFLKKYMQDEPVLPGYGNTPFSFEELQEAFNLALFYEEANGNKQIREYCSQLVTRLKSVIDNPDYEFLRTDTNTLKSYDSEPARYVDRLLGIEIDGKRYRKKRQICIIDLNDAPDEIVELASAVISRLIFDRMRHADPRNEMPIHLILEEAHRYISEKPGRFAIDAGMIFQRIAKEGRKYGNFLIVASQRPNELSKTVLSQCNNFIIHRIQNPDDLSQIRQMTPFISETVLRRLPSLPKQHALIFGNSVNMPTTFRVRDANPPPHSSDTQIRDIWYVPYDPKIKWVPQ